CPGRWRGSPAPARRSPRARSARHGPAGDPRRRHRRLRAARRNTRKGSGLLGNGLAGYTRSLVRPLVSQGPRGVARNPMVLVVGAASRDITPDDPRGWRLGGAATYGSLLLARLGL